MKNIIYSENSELKVIGLGNKYNNMPDAEIKNAFANITENPVEIISNSDLQAKKTEIGAVNQYCDCVKIENNDLSNFIFDTVKSAIIDTNSIV